MKAGTTLLLAVCVFPSPLPAQSHIYVGVLGGLATLSGDGQSVVTSSSVATSLYDPRNGPAATVFCGVHLLNYVSVQGNYIWNRNDVTLVSSFASPGGFSFYRQPESATESAIIGDVLVYFRKRGSRIRPYLSQGAGVVRLSSRLAGSTLSRGDLLLPPPLPASTVATARTAVGVDICLRPAWYFRYTFGENISHNPISAQLSPAGQRLLKNFQNLFGIYRAF